MQNQRRRQIDDFQGWMSGCLFATIAALAMAFPNAATAGSSPVPVPPPTPTPTPGPGRARPDGPQIDTNALQSLSLPDSEELQPLAKTVTTTSTVTAPVSIPVSAPLSRSAIGSLRSGLF